MAKSKTMDPKMMERIAERFRLLGDPLRLSLLHALADGELTVAELTYKVGSAQANVSKHLQMLLRAGVVSRRKEGLFVYYRVTDRRVFDLCDVVCGSVTDFLKGELSAMQGSASPRRRRTGV